MGHPADPSRGVFCILFNEFTHEWQPSGANRQAGQDLFLSDYRLPKATIIFVVIVRPPSGPSPISWGIFSELFAIS
jgi:hypothetical protein